MLSAYSLRTPCAVLASSLWPSHPFSSLLHPAHCPARLPAGDPTDALWLPLYARDWEEGEKRVWSGYLCPWTPLCTVAWGQIWPLRKVTAPLRCPSFQVTPLLCTSSLLQDSHPNPSCPQGWWQLCCPCPACAFVNSSSVNPCVFSPCEPAKRAPAW